MGWIWFILEIVALIVFPPLGIAMILGRWLYWLVKKKIMLDIRFIYFLFVAVPHTVLWWLLLGLHLIMVEIGLNGIKFSFHWTDNLASKLHEGAQVIENYSREALGFIVLWGAFIVSFITPPLSGSITENIITYAAIFGLIFVPILIGATVLNLVNGGKLASKAKQGAQRAAQAPRQARNNMQNLPGEAPSVRGTAEKVRGGQHRRERVVEHADTIERGAKKAESIIRNSEGKLKLVPNNFKTAIAKLVKTLPGGKAVLKKGEKTAGRAAAKKGARTAAKVGKGAAKVGKAAESVSVLPAILLIVFMAPIIWGIQAAIIGGTFVGMVNFYMPMVMGPAMDAVGLGGAYANAMGDEVANSEVGVAASEGNLLPAGVSRTVSRTGAKLGCMLEGPQCLRQWEMNNTVRPGSEATGEAYELQIAQFSLGTDRVDVAYKEANYTLPVNFLVENTRNGLKGINARNVSYKIDIKDSSNTYCTTDWEDISSFDDDSRNYILPGLGVSPTSSLSELNLGDCGLLRPSMGDNLVMQLSVRYNYASQATLYVDAMSREHRREQGLRPDFKKSETAKTPVQSYINVKSPITFYETESGDRNAVPFSARFGFDTPGFNSEYRINPESIRIADSSVTTHTDTCTGLNPDEDLDNYYDISESAKERISLRQNNSWFNSENEPAPLRCTMKIKDDDLGQISPTGEQLIMRIDGNYTIKKQDSMKGFDVVNSLCSRYNCPMLVTESYNESSEYNLYSKCSTENSIDARDGCTVREPATDSSGWRTPNIIEGLTIQEGETAQTAGNYLDNLNLTDHFDNQNIEKSKLSFSITESSAISAPELSRRQKRSDGVLMYQESSEGRNLQFDTLNRQICEEEVSMNGDVSSMSEAIKSFMDIWQSEQGDKISIAAGIDTTQCSTYLERLGFVGDNIQDDVRSCDGVVISQNRNVRCYGGSFDR